MSMGNGPGLSNRPIGQRGGAETTVHVGSNLPSHNHLINTTETTPNTHDPNGAIFATFGAPNSIYTNGGPTINHQMANNAMANSGANQPVNNMQPFQVALYCVAMQGLYPSRN